MSDSRLISFSNVPSYGPLLRAWLERSLHPAMGWGKQERERRVAALRKAARQCGVPADGPGGWRAVKDTSKRSAVDALAAACAASSGPGAAKAKAKEAHEAYLETFTSAPADPAPEGRALPLSPSRRSRAAFARARSGAGPKGKAKPAAKAKAKEKARAKAKVRAQEDRAAEAPDAGETPGGGAQEGGPEEEGEAAAEGAPNEEGEAEGGRRVEQTRMRVRGKSFLLTYNHLFFSAPFKDGSPPFASMDALWVAWREWEKERTEALGIVKATSTVEASVASADADRVHIHWKIDLKEGRCPLALPKVSLRSFGAQRLDSRQLSRHSAPAPCGVGGHISTCAQGGGGLADKGPRGVPPRHP